MNRDSTTSTTAKQLSAREIILNEEKKKLTATKESKINMPSIFTRRGSLSQLPTKRDETSIDAKSTPPTFLDRAVSSTMPTTPATTTVTRRSSSYHKTTGTSTVNTSETRSRNIHSEFVGLKEFKRLNANQIKLFEQWYKDQAWRKFHNSHYDWWIFPICDKSNFGFKYSIFDDVMMSFFMGLELFLINFVL